MHMLKVHLFQNISRHFKCLVGGGGHASSHLLHMRSENFKKVGTGFGLRYNSVCLYSVSELSGLSPQIRHKPADVNLFIKDWTC